MLLLQDILFLASNTIGHDFLPVHASIKSIFLKWMELSGKMLLTYFIANSTCCQEIKCCQIVPVYLWSCDTNVELENLLKLELFNEWASRYFLYGFSHRGQWEHSNILTHKVPICFFFYQNWPSLFLWGRVCRNAAYGSAACRQFSCGVSLPAALAE